MCVRTQFQAVFCSAVVELRPGLGRAGAELSDSLQSNVSSKGCIPLVEIPFDVTLSFQLLGTSFQRISFGRKTHIVAILWSFCANLASFDMSTP